MATGTGQIPAAFSDNAPQVLATEHWSLLATRSMCWNEAATRTSVFLNVLSAAAVALALVADATAFGDGFALFALVLFPLVLFLGLATFARLVQINTDDAYQILAMNRLRQGYLRLAPEVEPFFSSGWHDDATGIFQTVTLGSPPPKRFLQVFITTPTVVATINAIITAAGSALVGSRVGLSGAALIVLAVAAFAVVWAVLFALQVRRWKSVEATVDARFPTPTAS